MPDPTKYENEDAYMHDCVPMKMGEGMSQDQAVAVCMATWSDKGCKPKKPKKNMSLIYKNIAVASFEGLADRCMKAIVSAENVDEEGDVVLLAGCDASAWNNNPLFLNEHNVDEILGHGLSLNREGNALVAILKFMDKPETWPWQSTFLPDEQYALYKAGEKRQFSIGFNPIEVRKPSKLDKEKYGESCRRVISKWKLYEVSGVSIAANQSTGVLAIKSAVETPKSTADDTRVDMSAVVEHPKASPVPVANPVTEKTVESKSEKIVEPQTVVAEAPSPHSTVVEAISPPAPVVPRRVVFVVQQASKELQVAMRRGKTFA
jgi:HK97 family phage prohead protease